MVCDQIGIVLLDIDDHIRIDGVVSNDDLEVLRIEAGGPTEVHFSGTFIGCIQIVRHGTFGCRLQLDLIQHNTVTEVIGTFKGDLISLTYFRKIDLHTLPAAGRTTVLAQLFPLTTGRSTIQHTQRIAVSAPFWVRIPEGQLRHIHLSRTEVHYFTNQTRLITECLTRGVTQIGTVRSFVHRRRMGKDVVFRLYGPGHLT